MVAMRAAKAFRLHVRDARAASVAIFAFGLWRARLNHFTASRSSFNRLLAQPSFNITSKSTELEGLEFLDGATNRLGFGLSAGFKSADPANLVYGQWAVTAP